MLPNKTKANTPADRQLDSAGSDGQPKRRRIDHSEESGSGSTGSFAWGSAPADVLNVIFSCINLRPLISVVSVVCRWWRKVALDNPVALPVLKPGELAKAVAVLRNVTSLRGLHFNHTRLPHTLCHLEIAAGWQPDDRVFAGITSLKSLSIPCANSTPLPAAFILNNHDTITNLELRAAQLEDIDQLAALRLPYFPNLSSLALMVTDFWGAPAGQGTLGFVASHSQQLTTLRLLAHSPYLMAGVLKRVNLPMLRELQGTCESRLIYDLAPNAPALRSVSLACFWPLVIPADIASRIVTLHIMEEQASFPATGLDQIVALSRLTCLDLRWSTLDNTLAPPLTHVTSLVVGALAPSFGIAACFPSLRSLSLINSHFPRDSLIILTNLCAARLRLRTLAIRFTAGPFRTQELGTLLDCLGQLERSGLELLTVFVDTESVQLRLLTNRFNWLTCETVVQR